MVESPSITIYPDALKSNLQTVNQLAPQSKVLAVVKANAYGHGVDVACEALSAADGFAVARLYEATVLRQKGFQTKPLIIFSEHWQTTHLKLLKELKACPVLYQIEHLSMFENSDIPCWVMLDTGMHRSGLLSAEDLLRLDGFLKKKPDSVLMTHFAESEIDNKHFTQQQIDSFQEITGKYSHAKSMANSGAIMQHCNSHADWVRPGIMLYGASPCPQLDINLQCTMQLNATVTAKRIIEAGETVGYNRTWAASSRASIATVNLGYADGYPRQANDTTPVHINGQLHKLAGRVSMDALSIDVSSGEVEVGDQVELWGPNLDVNTVAKHCSTISYHLFTSIMPRVKRLTA